MIEPKTTPARSGSMESLLGSVESEGPSVLEPPRPRIVSRWLRMAGNGMQLVRRALQLNQDDAGLTTRHQRSLEKALDAVLREIQKCTEADIIQKIPEKLNRLDVAFRRYKDKTEAMACLDAAIRRQVEGMPFASLEKLRAFDGGVTSLYYGNKASRLERQRELGDSIVRHAVARDCELVLRQVLEAGSLSEAARQLGDLVGRLPATALLPAGTTLQRCLLWEKMPGWNAEKRETHFGREISTTLGTPYGTHEDLAGFLRDLTGRMTESERGRLHELNEQVGADTERTLPEGLVGEINAKRLLSHLAAAAVEN